jgi:hypothetical protein
MTNELNRRRELFAVAIVFATLFVFQFSVTLGKRTFVADDYLSWFYPIRSVQAQAKAFSIHVMLPMMNAHSQAIWQAQTPYELQGRVFAVRRLIAQFSWPLSTLLAGLVGGLFNPGTVVSVLGGILFLFCVGQMFNPYVLRVEDKAWLDAMAAQRLITVEAE